MPNIYTEFVDGMPGVTTIVTQRADFGALTDDQLKRLLRACDRGRTAWRGYVASLVGIAATKTGLSKPVIVYSQNSWRMVIHVPNLPPSATEDMFAELMQLSNVRSEMQIASTGCSVSHRMPEAKFSKRLDGTGSSLLLPGWSRSFTLGANEIMKIVNTIPGYKEDMAKLKAFIASRPVFTFESTHE